VSRGIQTASTSSPGLYHRCHQMHPQVRQQQYPRRFHEHDSYFPRVGGTPIGVYTIVAGLPNRNPSRKGPGDRIGTYKRDYSILRRGLASSRLHNSGLTLYGFCSHRMEMLRHVWVARGTTPSLFLES